MTALALWGLVKRFWWAAPLLGLTVALLLTRATLADRTQKLAETNAAFMATIANYRAATELARAQDAANAARVKVEQEAISKEITDDYQSRLADARALADRLRRATQANPGSGGNASVPETGATASSIDGAAEGDGLSIVERLIATEQSIQLAALQDWVRKQAALPQ